MKVNAMVFGGDASTKKDLKGLIVNNLFLENSINGNYKLLSFQIDLPSFKALEILARPLQNLKRDLTSEFGSLIFPFRAGKTLPAHHVLCCAELQSPSTHIFFLCCGSTLLLIKRAQFLSAIRTVSSVN